jgi:hypothetical protein
MTQKLTYLIGLAGICGAVLILPLHAVAVTEGEFENAIIEIEQGKPESGQHIQSLLVCLRNWHLQTGPSETKVSIEQNGETGFTVRATLRGPTLFHFDIRHEQGDTVALLKEVEYQRPGEMFDSVRDSDSKRAILRSLCGT